MPPKKPLTGNDADNQVVAKDLEDQKKRNRAREKVIDRGQTGDDPKPPSRPLRDVPIFPGITVGNWSDAIDQGLGSKARDTKAMAEADKANKERLEKFRAGRAGRSAIEAPRQLDIARARATRDKSDELAKTKPSTGFVSHILGGNYTRVNSSVQSDINGGLEHTGGASRVVNQSANYPLDPGRKWLNPAVKDVDLHKSLDPTLEQTHLYEGRNKIPGVVDEDQALLEWQRERDKQTRVAGPKAVKKAKGAWNTPHSRFLPGGTEGGGGDTGEGDLASNLKRAYNSRKDKEGREFPPGGYPAPVEMRRPFPGSEEDARLIQAAEDARQEQERVRALQQYGPQKTRPGGPEHMGPSNKQQYGASPEGNGGDMAMTGGGSPQFQASRPQGVGSNVQQMAAPQGNHKGSVLGTLAGVGMGLGTGNWVPLATSILGSSAGAAVGGAVGGGDPSQQQKTTPAPDASAQGNGEGSGQVQQQPQGAEGLQNYIPLLAHFLGQQVATIMPGGGGSQPGGGFGGAPMPGQGGQDPSQPQQMAALQFPSQNAQPSPFGA